MNIVFLGGDMRTNYACDYIKEAGYEPFLLNSYCKFCACEEKYLELARIADILVLPAPLSSDDIHVKGTITHSGKIRINELFENIKDSAIVFSSKVKNEYKKPTLKYVNYLEDEGYLLEGAYLTAEGTLGHLLSLYPKVLRNKKILLIGWGRIAKYLYNQLSFYTENISIILRNEEKIKELTKDGVSAKSFEILPESAKEADIIINTVPHIVLTRIVLSELLKSTYLIDLASLPGGIDFETAKEFGLEAHHLLALPGKCAPVSAGEALGRCILNYIANPGINERTDFKQ